MNCLEQQGKLTLYLNNEKDLKYPQFIRYTPPLQSNIWRRTLVMFMCGTQCFAVLVFWVKRALVIVSSQRCTKPRGQN